MFSRDLPPVLQYSTISANEIDRHEKERKNIVFQLLKYQKDIQVVSQLLNVTVSCGHPIESFL